MRAWHYRMAGRKPPRDLYFFLAAGSFSVAAMAGPLLFPDLPRIYIWILFSIGLFGGVVFTGLAVRVNTSKRTIFIAIILLLSIVGGSWYFWPTDIFVQHLQGLSVIIDGVFHDIPGRNSGNIFEISNNDGAHASLRISNSDLFTCVVTDIYGSSYDLEAKFDKEELPSGQRIVLTCEVALLDNISILRILVNTKEIERRTVPARLLLGLTEWRQSQIGGGAPFAISTLLAGSAAASNDEISKIVIAEMRL